MARLASIIIHESQFPDSVKKDLLTSLRIGLINHKFHYDSIKQTQKWLALHETYSPARTDPDCAKIYDSAFEAVVRGFNGEQINLIGLGAGGGKKDTRLLQLLVEAGKDAAYRPVEAGTAMALTACEEALKVIEEKKCFPFVCDLAQTHLSDFFGIPGREDVTRIFTFFGMLPNFEPQAILPEFGACLRAGDILLVSANLAPGADYEAGIRRIMPLYDNAPTRDWLMTFLLDLGIEQSDGELRFSLQNDSPGSGLQRIVANFIFSKERFASVEGEEFRFEAGKSIRLFFSYRHTPELLGKVLSKYGLRMGEKWMTRSGQEGVFQVVSTLTEKAGS